MHMLYNSLVHDHTPLILLLILENGHGFLRAKFSSFPLLLAEWEGATKESGHNLSLHLPSEYRLCSLSQSTLLLLCAGISFNGPTLLQHPTVTAWKETPLEG